MTREEAIEILKKYKDESEEDYWVKRAEALRMAIEALESQMIDCDYCKFNNRPSYAKPCCDCFMVQSEESYFEPKEDK